MVAKRKTKRNEFIVALIGVEAQTRMHFEEIQADTFGGLVRVEAKQRTLIHVGQSVGGPNAPMKVPAETDSTNRAERVRELLEALEEVESMRRAKITEGEETDRCDVVCDEADIRPAVSILKEPVTEPRRAAPASPPQSPRSGVDQPSPRARRLSVFERVEELAIALMEVEESIRHKRETAEAEEREALQQRFARGPEQENNGNAGEKSMGSGVQHHPSASGNTLEVIPAHSPRSGRRLSVVERLSELNIALCRVEEKIRHRVEEQERRDFSRLDSAEGLAQDSTLVFVHTLSVSELGQIDIREDETTHRLTLSAEEAFGRQHMLLQMGLLVKELWNRLLEREQVPTPDEIEAEIQEDWGQLCSDSVIHEARRREKIIAVEEKARQKLKLTLGALLAASSARRKRRESGNEQQHPTAPAGAPPRERRKSATTELGQPEGKIASSKHARSALRDKGATSLYTEEYVTRAKSVIERLELGKRADIEAEEEGRWSTLKYSQACQHDRLQHHESQAEESTKKKEHRALLKSVRNIELEEDHLRKEIIAGDSSTRGAMLKSFLNAETSLLGGSANEASAARKAKVKAELCRAAREQRLQSMVERSRRPSAYLPTGTKQLLTHEEKALVQKNAQSDEAALRVAMRLVKTFESRLRSEIKNSERLDRSDAQLLAMSVSRMTVQQTKAKKTTKTPKPPTTEPKGKAGSSVRKLEDASVDDARAKAVGCFTRMENRDRRAMLAEEAAWWHEICEYIRQDHKAWKDQTEAAGRRGSIAAAELIHGKPAAAMTSSQNGEGGDDDDEEAIPLPLIAVGSVVAEMQTLVRSLSDDEVKAVEAMLGDEQEVTSPEDPSLMQHEEFHSPLLDAGRGKNMASETSGSSTGITNGEEGPPTEREFKEAPAVANVASPSHGVGTFALIVRLVRMLRISH